MFILCLYRNLATKIFFTLRVFVMIPTPLVFYNLSFLSLIWSSSCGSDKEYISFLLHTLCWCHACHLELHHTPYTIWQWFSHLSGCSLKSYTVYNLRYNSTRPEETHCKMGETIPVFYKTYGMLCSSTLVC